MIEIRRTLIFDEWLKGLRDQRASARILMRIDRMRLGLLGDIKPVGSGVSEARVDYGPGYRVYFVKQGDVLIILLCGGDKGSQNRDISKALALAKELENGA